MLLLILQLAMMQQAPAWSPAGTGPPECDGLQDEPEGSQQPREKGSRMGADKGRFCGSATTGCCDSECLGRIEPNGWLNGHGPSHWMPMPLPPKS